MKGYLVGYLDTWGNDRTTQISGYCTSWKKAISTAKPLEAENVFRYNKQRKVFIVELEPNKNYKIIDHSNWIYNYKNYNVETTEKGFTVTDPETGRNCDTNFKQSSWAQKKL